MSGLEALGISLALLPLVISAAEDYNKCIGPFIRYKHFAKEAEQFVELVGVQETIFRNECEILLQSVLEKEKASSMLGTPGHSSWHDVELDQRLLQLLDKSSTACITAIKLISRRLRDIEVECQELVVTLKDGEMRKQKQESTISWKRRIKNKLRASFSESRWSEIIKDLRAWNSDFGILASQSLKSNAKPRPLGHKISKEVEQAILEYDTVGKASRQLYEALGQSCTKHTEHLAHTGVMVEYKRATSDDSHEVKFHMALAGSTRKRDLMSFIVASTLEDSSIDDEASLTIHFSDTTHPGKRRFEMQTDHTLRKTKKSVRFEPSVAKSQSVSRAVASIEPYALDSQLKKDFCDHLRRCMSQPITSYTCIGTLDSRIGCENAVFLATSDNHPREQQAISLCQLISALPKNDSIKAFSIPDRIQLAKVLTIAALQYRATPWLRMSWNSTDVIFFGTDPESILKQRSALTSPHLNARVKGPADRSIRGTNQSQGTSEARNPLLYNLGIMLLEIAYWKSWEYLKQTQKSERGGQDAHSDIRQARRLLDSSCSDMGGQYNEIVENLIECEFRCGRDLSTIQLQAAVYRDVICPLQELENGFKALHIGRKSFN